MYVQAVVRVSRHEIRRPLRSRAAEERARKPHDFVHVNFALGARARVGGVGALVRRNHRNHVDVVQPPESEFRDFRKVAPRELPCLFGQRLYMRPPLQHVFFWSDPSGFFATGPPEFQSSEML